LNDVVLSVANRPLAIHLVSATFPSIDQIKQGIGEIRLAWTAELPVGATNRTLSFENHHQPTMSVYLVNTLVPQDKNIHLGAQSRNVNQSSYRVDFALGAGASQTATSPSFSGFDGAFRLGVLIAVSILVSAIHAMRPIFPGREAAIAALSGLIHGLAFASASTELGFSHWYRLVSILTFNLGIEAMQLLVVTATLPSLLLLSRTGVYASFRWTDALIAAVVSISWIVERTFNIPNELGAATERAAHYGPWLAAILLVLSLLSWLWSSSRAPLGLQANSEH
jgi:hypothetical protein